MNTHFKILFMGTSDFAVPALSALRGAGYPVCLVVTQPDRPAGRGLGLKASPLKIAAEGLGLAVFQPEKLRHPEALEILKSHQPDVTVVAAYGQILPLAVLQVARVTSLNIHGSILPKYRGAAPIHYAVMAGEKETGVTIMYMNEKLDEGDMLLTKKTPIGPEETTGEVHDRLSQLGVGQFQKAVGIKTKITSQGLQRIVLWIHRPDNFVQGRDHVRRPVANLSQMPGESGPRPGRRPTCRSR